MNEEKMYLINKIFNNKTIRTIWNKDKDKYYLSVVDNVGALTESKDNRKYWNKLQQRLREKRKRNGDKLSPVEIKSPRW